jgi:uncharacterized protein with PIN domain
MEEGRHRQNSGGAESSQGVTFAPMRQATLRFYAELSDFLPTERTDKDFPHSFLLPPSIKDVIESLGVPHTEVDRILVNGVPVDFSYLIQDGDRVRVYPIPTSPPETPVIPLRPPVQEFRFVLDTHLGRLATYLRMFGFDVLYQNRCDDAELAHISAAEDRILLTRDLGLLKRGEVVWGYFVRATEPKEQLVEVLRRFNLFRLAAPFRRCLRCNALLQTVAKESIQDRLAPRTAQCYNDFRICPSCDRLYWAGSHHEHMQRFIERIRGPK